MLLGAPGIATSNKKLSKGHRYERSKDETNGAPGIVKLMVKFSVFQFPSWAL